MVPKVCDLDLYLTRILSMPGEALPISQAQYSLLRRYDLIGYDANRGRMYLGKVLQIEEDDG